MASKTDRPSEKLPHQGFHCLKHSGIFELEYFCEECKTAVCIRCWALEHHDHECLNLKLKTEEEREEIILREKLGKIKKRKEAVQAMKRSCQEMSQHSKEVAEVELKSADLEHEFKKRRVSLKRDYLDTRISNVTECLDEEENELYALECSSLTILSSRRNEGNESSLKDIQERLDEHICSELPRIKTFNDLQDTCKKMTPTCSSQFSFAGTLNPSTSYSNVQPASGKVNEDVKDHADNLILYELARQIHPNNYTPLGLGLSVSNITLQQVRTDHQHDIVEAIYQVLQKWKGTLSTVVMTEDHFDELEKCLRKNGDNDAADWLMERLQKFTNQPVQPSSSPDQLMQPAECLGQLVQPTSSPDQLMETSSSPDQLVQPTESSFKLVQPASSRCQLEQSVSSGGQLEKSAISSFHGQLATFPSQLLQPLASSGQLVQPSSTPGQDLQLCPSPVQLAQPDPSHGQLVQPSSTPGQDLQLCSSLVHLAQPDPSPGQLVQPSSTPGQDLQLSSSPVQLAQPDPSPGQLVQPAPSLEELKQSATSPGQLVQPPSSDTE